ncbi:MAG: hypothetical protein H6711_20065 [Myxococcales bacterium]|nr:hypothetical protein [Myxococcales bacterium]
MVPMPDPEEARVAELLDRVRRGELSEGEREELALYAAEDPSLHQAIAARSEEARLGEGWLARVEADDRIATIEGSRGVQIERGIGLALVLGGLVTSSLAPLTGSLALLAGVLLLIYSFARVRLATHRRDPYKDIKR